MAGLGRCDCRRSGIPARMCPGRLRGMGLSVGRHAAHGATRPNGVSNVFTRPGIRRTWGGLRLIVCSDQGVRVTTTKAARVRLLHHEVRREAFAEASRFRGAFYECPTARRDELFEPADAVLCADGAVKSPVGLTLPEHRRGHGAMYGGLNHGRIDVDRLQAVPAGLPPPRFDDGRLVLAVDVSPWLRSDAPCSAERLSCHVYGRAKAASQFISGRPHSFVAVLEPGATSWTAILDAVRLGPVDDTTAITTITDTANYGKAETQAWDRVRPRTSTGRPESSRRGAGRRIRRPARPGSPDRPRPPARRNEPFDHLADLTCGDRRQIGARGETDRVQERRPGSAATLQGDDDRVRPAGPGIIRCLALPRPWLPHPGEGRSARPPLPLSPSR